MSLSPLHPPAVLPRLLLGIGAAAAALTLPVWVAGVVLLGAAQPLARRGDRGMLRMAAWAVAGFSLVTVLVTPLWLHLLVSIPFEVATRTALALLVRLDAVLVVGLALSVVLPPVAWLAATRRFPRIGLALALTFRQVPELAAETARVRRVQRARGLLTGSPLGPRALIVPVVTRSLERAERLGETLVLSGWTGGRPAHPVVRNRYRASDAIWILAGVGLLAAALLQGINLP